MTENEELKESIAVRKKIIDEFGKMLNRERIYNSVLLGCIGILIITIFVIALAILNK